MLYNELITLITIFFSIFIVFICISALMKKKYAILTESIIIYILYLSFLIIQNKFKLYVNPFIIFLVMITFIGNSFVGQYLNYYHSSKYYDRFLHGFGAISFSLFIYSILFKITAHHIYSKVYDSIFVLAIGISLGCIFEVVEFIIDTISNSKNQHGLKDTNFDMIFNIIGAIIAAIIANLIVF